MKKFVSLILVIALMATMAAIPAMAEGEVPTATTQKYQIRGIRNGDVIVANEETSRTITFYDATNADNPTKAGNTAASDMSSVEFYIDEDKPVVLDSKPFEYELEFTTLGKHTFKAVVYYKDSNGDDVKNVFDDITYNVVLGTKLSGTFDVNYDNDADGKAETLSLPYSYEENFDSNPTVDGTKPLNTGVLGIASWGSNISGVTKSKKLVLTNASSKNPAYMSLTPFPQNTSTGVIYYSFEVPEAKNIYIAFKKNEIKNTNGTDAKLFDGGTSQLVNTSKYDGKIELIVDLNSKYVILRVNGKEYKRRAFTDPSGCDMLRIAIGPAKNETLTIDNFKCASYNIDETQDFGTVSELAGDTYTNEIDVTAVEDASITVKTRAMNTTDDAKTLTNIIAVYNSEDMLIASPIVDKDISYAAGAFGEKEYPVALPKDAAKVRVFTFDSLTNIVPVKAWQSAN